MIEPRALVSQRLAKHPDGVRQNARIAHRQDARLVEVNAIATIPPKPSAKFALQQAAIDADYELTRRFGAGLRERPAWIDDRDRPPRHVVGAAFLRHLAAAFEHELQKVVV